MSSSLQKLVHVGCRELGIDAETRRDLQLRITGKASLSDMTTAELTLVVKELKAQGFKTTNGRRKQAPRADLRMIHVLWRKLGDAGALERPGREGLNTFVRSQFETKWGTVPADIDMLRDWKQIDDVVQALKAWGRRASIDFDWTGTTK